MKNIPDWLTLIVTPPALIGVWFVDDMRVLRFLAIVWGLNLIWDSLGWVIGAVGYLKREES